MNHRLLIGNKVYSIDFEETKDPDELMYKTWLMDAIASSSCVWPTPRPEYVTRLAREWKKISDRVKQCPIIDTMGGTVPACMETNEINDKNMPSSDGIVDAISKKLHNRAKIAVLYARTYDEESEQKLGKTTTNAEKNDEWYVFDEKELTRLRSKKLHNEAELAILNAKLYDYENGLTQKS